MSVYFICASPGSSGNFLGKLIHNLIGSTSDQIVTPTFNQPEPEEMTSDFWFDNVNIGNATVVNVPFVPNYEKLNARFPGSKVIVLTHLINECYSIALNLWEGFHVKSYELGSEPHFRKILTSHSNLFSDLTATPDQLTRTEISTFVKILAYQKLIAGFHCVNIPQDPNVLEVKHRDLYYNRSKVKQDLELFTGQTFSEPAANLYDQIARDHIESFFRSSSLAMH